MLNKITMNSIAEEGFTFAATAEKGDKSVWKLRVWEIPSTAGVAPRWEDAKKAGHPVGYPNTHEYDLDMRHAPKHTGLVWSELADMISVALDIANSREACNAGPYSDLQSKGPTS